MNPWAGLSSYRDGDSRPFCGRDNESFDVSRLIDNSIFVTLYGKSGIGKSSLLNAGVFPRLRSLGYLPVSVRLGMEAAGQSLQSCIRARIEAALSDTGRILDCDVAAWPESETDETWLWTLFARSRFQGPEKEDVFPVLVFDQFEELLRTRAADAGVLLRQICYMMDETHTLPDRADYRYDFNFRFVVSIREDELYRLEDCIDANYLTVMKRCRYRLCGLTEDGAQDVVKIPGADYLDPGSAEEIARKLVGIARNREDGSISTNILSLICSLTFDAMSQRGSGRIDLPLVQSIVSENPFEKYYLAAVSGLSRRSRAYIEDQLVDSDERRNSVPESDFFKAVPEAEDLLREGPRKILQRVSGTGSNSQPRIELVHDSFCAPLAGFRKKRRQSRRSYLTAAFGVAAVLIALVSFGIIRSMKQREWKMLESQSRFGAETAIRLAEEGEYNLAKRIAAAVLPKNLEHPKDRPYVARAGYALLLATSKNGGLIRDKSGEIQSLAFSRDGDFLLSKSSEKQGPSVWNAAVGNSICDIILSDPDDQVVCASFSPDGKIIASGTLLGNLLLSDRKKGKAIKKLHVSDCVVSAVSFSPDGSALLTGSGDGVIRIWNPESQKLIRQIDGEETPLHSVKFSPEGSRIAALSDSTLTVWDAGSGLLSFTCQSRSMVRDFHFSPDGELIYLPSYSSLHTLYSLPALTYHTIASVHFVPSAIRVFDCNKRESVCTLDGISSISRSDMKGPVLSRALIQAGLHRSVSQTQPTYFSSFDISPDGKSLVLGNLDGSVSIWDTESGKETLTLKGPKRFDGTPAPSVTSVAFSPDGNMVASGLKNGTIRLWDLPSERNASNRQVSASGQVKRIANNHDGKRIAYSTTGDHIVVWDTEKQKRLRMMEEQDVYALAFHPEDTSIVTASWDHTLRVRSVATGDLILQIQLPAETYPVSCSFSPDGSRIIACFLDGEKGTWDSKTGDPVDWKEKLWKKGDSPALSPDGGQLATYTGDGQVRFLSERKGKTIHLSEGYKGYISAFAVSPDGSRLAMGFEDGSIRVWDGKSGTLLLTLDGGDLHISSLAFGMDGKSLTSACGKTITVWSLDLEGKLKEVRTHYPPLTREERESFFL